MNRGGRVQTETHDIAVEAAKGAPAVAGAVASVLTLNEWVAVATGIYILIQCLYLLRKWWRDEKDWAHRDEEHSIHDGQRHG
jgi:hypothetical protein